MNTDTIFAFATPFAKSAVAILRISGDKAYEISKQFTDHTDLKPRYAHLANIHVPSSGQVIDKALVLYFPAPHSFTGQDVVEFQLHGSIGVIRALSDEFATIEGVRLAEPGEFSKRAFENGKMDLIEAEGLSDLIAAETSKQAAQALRQMEGNLSHLYTSWRQELIEAMSHVEAYIDFPDEDIPQDIQDDISQKIGSLVASLQQHLADDNVGERLRSGVYGAIIGPPNAGKSTLINVLSKRDVALVSEIAGTTRDVIEAHLDIDGFPVILADTAGIREDTEDIIESAGIAKALEKSKQADFTILVLDSTELNDTARMFAQYINEKTIILVNKVDINSNLPSDIENYHYIPISLKDLSGLDALMDALQDKVANVSEFSDAPVITRTRHREAVSKSLQYLDMFTLDDPPELAAENLRNAAALLGRVVGLVDLEEILDHLFSEFCIGK